MKASILLVFLCAFTRALAGDVEPKLIGGREAAKADWPASVYSSQGNSRCTSTVVGKRTVLTAAHCVGNGGTLTFTDLAGKKYTSKCTHAPEYRGNSTADWALCLVTEDVSMLAEVLNQDEDLVKVGDEVLLAGYGCIRRGGSGGNDGKYRIGEAKVTQVPSGRSFDIVTKGNAALCFGDSGGAAFMLLPDDKRLLISVNSRGDIATTSYLSSVATAPFKAFVKSWSEKNGQKVCGVHDDAEGCRGAATGLVVPEGWELDAEFDDLQVQTDLPVTWDWRTVKPMQPIRNQRSCGSCWMFSVTAVMESLHRLLYPETSPMIDVSEQQGVSCSGYGSCRGGYFTAFNYLQRQGLGKEVDFPYAARDLRCKEPETFTKISSWKYVGSSRSTPTTEQLKQAIYDHGPISVDVNGSFSRYSGGVYTSCGSTGTNHMVTIEGWVDDSQYAAYGGGYWIMRNSWGESWGEKGYMRIVYKAKNSQRRCNGIGQIGAYAIMDGVENIRTHVIGE